MEKKSSSANNNSANTSTNKTRPTRTMKKNQRLFYDAMSVFVYDVVKSLFALTYNQFDKNVNYSRIQIMTKFCVAYFNDVAKKLFGQQNDDEYLSKMMNSIAGTKIGRSYHHYDILVFVFELCTEVLQHINMKVKHETIELFSKERTKEIYMEQISTHIKELLTSLRTTRPKYTGCNELHTFDDLNEEPFEIKIVRSDMEKDTNNH